MFRNAGLVLRSVVLSLALASVFACAAEDSGKEDQGSTGSDLSKGNKPKTVIDKKNNYNGVKTVPAIELTPILITKENAVKEYVTDPTLEALAKAGAK